MLMKFVALVVAAVALCASCLAADAPPAPSQTVELPVLLVLRITNVLAVEGGSTASLLVRGIDDCVRSQQPTQGHIGNQDDNCPDVTNAIKARSAALAKAIKDAKPKAADPAPEPKKEP
jgi:hypothetical protein